MAVKAGALLYIESSRGTRAFEGDTINITASHGRTIRNALIDLIDGHRIEIHPNINIYLAEIEDFTIQSRTKKTTNTKRKVRL